MKAKEEIPYEPGLIMIFRLFCGAVAIVFYIFSAKAPALYLLVLTQQAWFAMAMAYTVVCIYLLIPFLQHRLGSWYLPISIVATILIPILTLSWQPYLIEGSYLALNMISSYSISILLMFPLVITAWQYDLKVVILLFGLLGGIDPLIYLMIYGPKDLLLSTALYSSLIRIIAFIAIGFIITELMKNQRSKQRELSEANDKLRAHAHITRELSVTRERNRLAHELHDVLAHTLSSLAVQLEAIKATLSEDPRRTEELLQKALDNTRAGLKETRRTVRDLRAEPLEELGFTQSVLDLARDAEYRGMFQVILDLAATEDLIDHTNEHSLYRILQEALENCIHHAHASQVRISIGTDSEGGAVMRISDDGIGFDPAIADSSRHFGIATMRERAQSIGAAFSIESSPGGGTSITVTDRRSA